MAEEVWITNIIIQQLYLNIKHDVVNNYPFKDSTMSLRN